MIRRPYVVYAQAPSGWSTTLASRWNPVSAAWTPWGAARKARRRARRAEPDAVAAFGWGHRHLDPLPVVTYPTGTAP